jgi:hypothetical protein
MDKKEFQALRLEIQTVLANVTLTAGETWGILNILLTRTTGSDPIAFIMGHLGGKAEDHRAKGEPKKRVTAPVRKNRASYWNSRRMNEAADEKIKALNERTAVRASKVAWLRG